MSTKSAFITSANFIPSPVAPLWLVVANPFKFALYDTIISSFAPKPPAVSITAFVFIVYSFPSLSVALTPDTFPSLSNTISVALFHNLISTFSLSAASFNVFTMLAPAAAPPVGLCVL
ncbi:hypothetical protein D3C76_893640 [compost metagenome]